MRMFLTTIVAVLLNCVMGGTLAAMMGVDPAWGMAALNVIAAVAGPLVPKGAAGAGVLTEVWTGELVKSLRGKLSGSWLDGIPDASSIVNNDVIHLVDVGVDPDVLVNNTTYPIPLQALDDQDIAVKLDKFQTKVTPITDDELYASSYDKMSRVKEAHANALLDAELAKAAHALCPSLKNSGRVVMTTGETRNDVRRQRATLADVVSLKRTLDGLGVPAEGRRLVLCPDHVNDLLETEQTFREQYNINRGDGTVGRLYGFDVYEFGNTPVYGADGSKQDLGTLAGAGSEGPWHCSFAFYVPRVFKATGSVKMYFSAAETDPEYQRNKVNFRHMFLCMPKKEDAMAVLASELGE